MNNITEILEELNKLKPELRNRFKVKNIGIFGSYARNEETEDSDVDILVELEEPIGLDLVELIFFLEEKLCKKVDLVTTKSLRSEFQEVIRKEVVFT
jgi:predicted nucleotidyltransferase